MSSSAPAPQPRRNNAVWWIFGIVAGGTVLLIVFGLMFAGLFIRHVNVNESGNKLEIETAAGTLRVKSDEGHPTGLPVYPGASAVKAEGTSVEFLSENGAGGGITTETYTTSDNLDAVADWYAQKLGPKFRREERGETPRHFNGPGRTQADIAFINDSGEGARIVALARKSHSVEITLVSAGKKEIQ
jgi:hypothetical protein